MNPNNFISPQQARAQMIKLIEAQKNQTAIEFVPFRSRLHVSGFADETGYVGPQDVAFFSNKIGEDGQGFARKLTLCDTPFESTGAQMPAGQEFIGMSLGISVNPEMPRHIAEAIVYYGFLEHRRGVNTWKLGTAESWPCAEVGLQSKSAATTFASERIEALVNGGMASRALPDFSSLLFPSKQGVQLTLSLKRGFYATDTGQTIASGGKLIDNTGKVATGGSGGTIGTYQRENCGMFSCNITGYRVTAQG
jgi:hypothetical protein